jgi:hypothetical protein
MLFARKLMELEIMVLGKISQDQKDKFTCFCSYVKSRQTKYDTIVKGRLVGGPERDYDRRKI